MNGRVRLGANLTPNGMTIKIKNPSLQFLAKLEQTLTKYRSTLRTFFPKRCRLVQYVGAGRPNGFDITLAAIEDEITSTLAQGRIVDWVVEHEVLYVCTQEPDCAIPPWDKVKAEEGMVDVDAGFDV